GLSPQYDDAHNNLGIALFRRGQHEEAIKQFEIVLRKGPNLKAVYNLGVVVGTQGKRSSRRSARRRSITARLCGSGRNLRRRSTAWQQFRQSTDTLGKR